MRLRPSLLIALLAATPPLAAQTPAARSGWHLGGGVDALHFGPVAVGLAQAGVAAELRPSGRAAARIVVGRAAGLWNLSVEAGWADGHIEAGNDLLSVHDLTSDVSRYRLSPSVGRRLTATGVGALSVELAPTLDLWSVDGESRVRAGAEARLVLRVPLGSVELENRIGFGLSGSPVEAADVGQVADERGLRTLLIGLGLRAGL